MAAELWYPDLLQDGEAFPCHVLFTFFKRDSTKSSDLQDQVHLYMPEDFGQPNTLSWDSSFRAGQQLLSAAASGVGGLGSLIKSPGVSNFLKSASSAMHGVGNVSTDLAGVATGMIPNPYLTQMFRGIDMRNFEFTFRFVPFRSQDCDTIHEIIKVFRKWSLPEGPDAGGASFYLEYPGEVEVEYIFNGGNNVYLHKFKRSVITSLDVNYTGAGMWTMMRNGFPTETVMRVSFSEIQIVVRKDVEEGY
jgi:hypothetical protein